MIKKSTITGILISVFLTLPIGMYLTYWTLKQLRPDRLVWFLFIIYIPSVILTTILMKLAEED